MEFIPEEVQEETTAATAEKQIVPLADGYYWCHPVFAADTNKDGTPVDPVNIAVRVSFKAFETAPLGGDPMPCAPNCETASDTLIIVYGQGGKVYDMKKMDWRPATDADTEEAIAKLARVFPEWAAFETDDAAEKVAWFVTHLEEFSKCKCLCKISHSVSRKDGKTYANARICERKTQTADLGAISGKLTRSHKAILKSVMVKPKAKPEATAKVEAKPVESVPEMPSEAPAEGVGETQSSKAECWQYYCANHPDKGKTTGGWNNTIAAVKASRGKTTEAQFTAEDWGALLGRLMDEWVAF
jgi:hypothetical protein